jgi:hypothetical protein
MPAGLSSSGSPRSARSRARRADRPRARRSQRLDAGRRARPGGPTSTTNTRSEPEGPPRTRRALPGGGLGRPEPGDGTGAGISARELLAQGGNIGKLPTSELEAGLLGQLLAEQNGLHLAGSSDPARRELGAALDVDDWLERDRRRVAPRPPITASFAPARRGYGE